MKRCNRCQEEKPLSGFTADPRYRGGYKHQCWACQRELSRACRAAKPEKYAATAAAYYKKNKEKIRQYSAEWYRANAERRNAQIKAYNEANLERRRERAKLYRRRRLATDPAARLRSRISTHMRYVLKGKGGMTWASMLGYTPADLREHLERQFLPGMGWHNIEKWHIDHIVPVSSFNLTGPDDPNVRAAYALTNLRPLWARENIVKNARRTHLL